MNLTPIKPLNDFPFPGAVALKSLALVYGLHKKVAFVGHCTVQRGGW